MHCHNHRVHNAVHAINCNVLHSVTDFKHALTACTGKRTAIHTHSLTHVWFEPKKEKEKKRKRKKNPLEELFYVNNDWWVHVIFSTIILIYFLCILQSDTRCFGVKSLSGKTTILNETLIVKILNHLRLWRSCFIFIHFGHYECLHPV